MKLPLGVNMFEFITVIISTSFFVAFIVMGLIPIPRFPCQIKVNTMNLMNSLLTGVLKQGE